MAVTALAWVDKVKKCNRRKLISCVYVRFIRKGMLIYYQRGNESKSGGLRKLLKVWRGCTPTLRRFHLERIWQCPYCTIIRPFYGYHFIWSQPKGLQIPQLKQMPNKIDMWLNLDPLVNYCGCQISKYDTIIRKLPWIIHKMKHLLEIIVWCKINTFI